MISFRIALAAAALAASAPPMNAQQRTHTYVIVHGAWGGGWDWKQVDSALSTSANKVYRPTLTGLGERVHLLTPAIDLSTHIMDIVNVIRFENLRDVVLVGHSYGGMVISVADRIPDRIRRLVYVDAVVPEDGESLMTAAGGALLDSAGRAWTDSSKDAIVPDWVNSRRQPFDGRTSPEANFYRANQTAESGSASRSGDVHPDGRARQGRSGRWICRVRTAGKNSRVDVPWAAGRPHSRTLRHRGIDRAVATRSLR